MAAGQATITATTQGKSGTLAMTVTLPGGGTSTITGTFDTATNVLSVSGAG